MTALGESLKRFFERGPQRTQRLNEGISEALRYYLGPTGMDKRLALAAEMNPVQDVYQAGADMRDGNYAGAAVNTASALMPTIGAKMAGGGLADDAANVISDTLTNVGTKAQGAMDAGQGFAADEFGGVGPNKGIRAYHSSPHDFDRFSMDARGYGVGDQAFGDGHYFSDNEPRALAYRERLQKPQIDGRSIYSSGLSDDAQELVWKFSREKGQSTLQDVAKFAQEDLAARQSELPYSAVRAYNQIIEELGSMPDARITSPVKTYEVNINARPDEFLDWDASSPSNPSATVGDEFRRREAAIGRTNATRELAEQGYPGIAVKIGETGGKDYVVFDENLIEIVRKYGIAGAATLLGMTAAEVEAAIAE